MYAGGEGRELQQSSCSKDKQSGTGQWARLSVLVLSAIRDANVQTLLNSNEDQHLWDLIKLNYFLLGLRQGGGGPRQVEQREEDE